MIDRIEGAMTDIDAIIEGLSEAQKDALRHWPFWDSTGEELNILLDDGFLKWRSKNLALTRKGAAVRARLLGDK